VFYNNSKYLYFQEVLPVKRLYQVYYHANNIKCQNMFCVAMRDKKFCRLNHCFQPPANGQFIILEIPYTSK